MGSVQGKCDFLLPPQLLLFIAHISGDAIWEADFDDVSREPCNSHIDAVVSHTNAVNSVLQPIQVVFFQLPSARCNIVGIAGDLSVSWERREK